MGGQTISPQAIPGRMGCDDTLEWVGEEVLEEYQKLHHNRRLQSGKRSVHYVRTGSDREAVMDPV